MRISTTRASFAIAAMLSSSWSWAFQPPGRPTPKSPSSSSVRRRPIATSLRYSNWDAFETRDAMELMIGGTRYEMVRLPDSMVSTTLWVGNLCEFVTDEMLSEVFQQASTLKFVPACVARKPNMESMRYGFVTFRSVEEKETAMDLLHGYELQGKSLKIECIKDHEKYGRVRAPRKIVDYAVGPIKRQRNGELNTMRRVTANVARANSGGDEDRHSRHERERHRHERERRRVRMEKRKTRGRYKNQQRKNSRSTRTLPRI